MPVADADHLHRGWVPSFLTLAVLWGCSFAFIGIGLEALTPVQVAFWRLALGAITLLTILMVTRQRLPRRPSTWGHLVVLASLLNAAPFTLFALGQQSVSSVLAGIINAATPLVTLLVVLVAFPEEKPTRARIAGLLIGFAGILIVLGIWRGFAVGDWQGVLACLGAIVCYGLAFPYSRRHLSGTGDGPVSLATGQVSLAALIMVPVLAITGVAPESAVNARIALSMVALGALSSGVAYILNFRIIARAGSTTASSVTYLTPVVAAVIGVSVLGEELTWNQPVGALVVLLGVAVAQGRLPRLNRPVRTRTT